MDGWMSHIPLLTLQQYHSEENYGTAVYQACGSSCAQTQYNECGSGWTANDEAVYGVDLTQLQDPTLTAAGGNITTVVQSTPTASSPPPLETYITSEDGTPSNATISRFAYSSVSLWTVLALGLAVIHQHLRV